MTKPDLRCFHSLCNYQRPRPVLNTQADRPITPLVSSVRRIVQVASQWQTVVHLPITSSRKTHSLPCPPLPPPSGRAGRQAAGPQHCTGRESETGDPALPQVLHKPSTSSRTNIHSSNLPTNDTFSCCISQLSLIYCTIYSKISFGKTELSSWREH